MREFGAKLIAFSNQSPTFKGTTVAIIGLLALLFAYWMQKRWQEPVRGGFLVFICIAVFIVFYGLFILIFQPNWWALPY